MVFIILKVLNFNKKKLTEKREKRIYIRDPSAGYF